MLKFTKSQVENAIETLGLDTEHFPVRKWTDKKKKERYVAVGFAEWGVDFSLNFLRVNDQNREADLPECVVFADYIRANKWESFVSSFSFAFIPSERLRLRGLDGQHRNLANIIARGTLREQMLALHIMESHRLNRLDRANEIKLIRDVDRVYLSDREDETHWPIDGDGSEPEPVITFNEWYEFLASRNEAKQPKEFADCPAIDSMDSAARPKIAPIHVAITIGCDEKVREIVDTNLIKRTAAAILSMSKEPCDWLLRNKFSAKLTADLIGMFSKRCKAQKSTVKKDKDGTSVTEEIDTLGSVKRTGKTATETIVPRWKVHEPHLTAVFEAERAAEAELDAVWPDEGATGKESLDERYDGCIDPIRRVTTETKSGKKVRKTVGNGLSKTYVLLAALLAKHGGKGNVELAEMLATAIYGCIPHEKKPVIDSRFDPIRLKIRQVVDAGGSLHADAQLQGIVALWKDPKATMDEATLDRSATKGRFQGVDTDMISEDMAKRFLGQNPEQGRGRPAKKKPSA